jgi:hypothetical protein
MKNREIFTMFTETIEKSDLLLRISANDAVEGVGIALDLHRGDRSECTSNYTLVDTYLTVVDCRGMTMKARIGDQYFYNSMSERDTSNYLERIVYQIGRNLLEKDAGKQIDKRLKCDVDGITLLKRIVEGVNALQENHLLEVHRKLSQVRHGNENYPM